MEQWDQFLPLHCPRPLVTLGASTHKPVHFAQIDRGLRQKGHKNHAKLIIQTTVFCDSRTAEMIHMILWFMNCCSFKKLVTIKTRFTPTLWRGGDVICANMYFLTRMYNICLDIITEFNFICRGVENHHILPTMRYDL